MSWISTYTPRMEAIENQLEDWFWSLQNWMRKMEEWYPEVSSSIENLLDLHHRFPDQKESPTGNTFISNNFDWKEIVWDPRFSDECWQAILLKWYPFPDSYKTHPDLLRAIDISLEIQNEILSSQSYQSWMKEVKELPIREQAREALEQSSALRFHLEISEQQGITLDRFMQVIAIWAPRRLQQIVYSVEEAKYKERITEEIWNPMSRMRYEIDDKMFAWEKL